MNSDSVDKIVQRYFAVVARRPFTYKGKTYDPKPLRVSPLFLRDYTCPPMCGGCCFKFTLDYLPSESEPGVLSKRMIEFNGKGVEIWTDYQSANSSNRCQYLRSNDGRCGIYKDRPFSCDFELIRALHSEDPGTANVLTQKLFGRGWSYLRVDGGKGALCEMTKVTNKSIFEVCRKLDRLQSWAKHFGVKTWIPVIKEIIAHGRLDKSVLLKPESESSPSLGL